MNMRKIKYGLLLFLLMLGAATYAKLPASVDGHPLPSLAPMLKEATQAVVNISSARTYNNPLLNDPFFRHFFNLPEQQTKQSRGSGVIIDAKKGHVVTNHHVVDRADTIAITLLDGREFQAELVGSDPETDVALLKMPTDNLTALPLADSDELQVGDFVVAIGNPFGLGQTVTSGIVSALKRSGLGIEGYEDFIQTDASINPGNSGGALVNLRGELVGVNTAIIAPGGGNVGIGFAIPSNMVNQVISHLEQYGEVRRGRLGIQIQDLTPTLASAFGLPNNRGAVVAKVEPGTPAEQAGLQSGDIIISLNEVGILSATELRNRVGLLRVGETVKMTVVRQGKKLNLQAVIADIDTVNGEEVSFYLKGTRLKENSDSSIEIYKITQDSNAWQLGFREGDEIIGFNRKKINGIEDLTQRFRRYTAYSIQVRREDMILSIRLNK
jgi:serine protease DegQ